MESTCVMSPRSPGSGSDAGSRPFGVAGNLPRPWTPRLPPVSSRPALHCSRIKPAASRNTGGIVAKVPTTVASGAVISIGTSNSGPASDETSERV